MISWRKRKGGEFTGLKSAEITLCGITQHTSFIKFPTITKALELGDIIDIFYEKKSILKAIIVGIDYDGKAGTTRATLSPLWRYAGQSAPAQYGQMRNISLAGLLNNILPENIKLKVDSKDFSEIIPIFTILPWGFNVAAIAENLQDFGKLIYAPDGRTIKHFTPSPKAVANFVETQNITRINRSEALFSQAKFELISQDNATSNTTRKDAITVRYTLNHEAINAELAAQTKARALRLTHLADFVELATTAGNQPLAKPGDKINIDSHIALGTFVVRETSIMISPARGREIIYKAIPAEVFQ